MIKHIVTLRLRQDHAPRDLDAVMAGLEMLVGEIDGFTGFQHGPNRDYEEKSPDHRHGFICTFEDANAVARYAEDPRHQVLGSQLVALCEGGGDGIIVYDLEVSG